MNITVQTLPKNQVVLTVDIPFAELKPHIEDAARRVSKNVTIEGFRPGNVPYDIVKNRVGEMAIYEEAAEYIVRSTYPKAVLEKQLEVIGQPKIDMVKLAPGNPFVYRATVSLLPSVALPAYDRCSVSAKTPEVTDVDVERTLKELQKLQTTEVVVGRAATVHDKVVIDMTISLDGVAVDGGTAKDHVVLLGEQYYIPGLPEQLIGIKKGDTKEFSLPFPKEHYQKHLAGKTMDFTVTGKSVFELTPPPLDDAFAVRLGQKTIGDVKELLRKNLQAEADRKESDRQDIAMLEHMIEKSTFGEIPDVLVANEIERMMQELEADVAARMAERAGGTRQSFDDYLSSIHKTRDDLRRDFQPQAIKRVKTALCIRAVAKQETMTLTTEEVQRETDAMLAMYAKDEETQNRIRSEDGQDYIRTIIQNRNVIAFLKEKVVK